MLEILVLISLGLVTLIIWLEKRRYSYWLERGVKQPPTKFFFGNMKDAYLGQDNNGLVLYNIYKSYPNSDAVGVYDLLTPKLLVKSPELLKKVMASEFSSFHDNDFPLKENVEPYLSTHPFSLCGDNWKVCRASYIPLFTQNRIKEIYPTMLDVVTRLDEYVQKNINDDFEVKELATLFTMDLISSCVYGVSSNCFKDPNSTFRKMGELQMKDRIQSFWKTVILFRLPKIRDLLRYTILANDVGEYLKHIVEHRQRSKDVRNDLLHHMIKINADNSSNQLIGQASVFFVEGFDASSMLASFALYELALNSKMQDTLFEELNTSIGYKDEITLDILTTLPYLDKVVQETLRKYPSMFTYQRICTKDISLEIDGKMVEIQKGTPIFVPVYSIHHDPEYYPNPEVFDPERFNADNIASRPAYTFMPFGEGPRICVGSRLGILEIKLFLTHIIRKYKVLKTEKTPLNLTLETGAWLVVPKEQRRVQLVARTTNTT